MYKKISLVLLFTLLTTNAFASPARKEVAGQALLCDISGQDEDRLTHCKIPKPLSNVILNVQRIGAHSKASKVYGGKSGYVSILRLPGRYKVSIAPEYQEKINSCDLLSFPESEFEKVLLVGPKNKKKDLYFWEFCSV